MIPLRKSDRIMLIIGALAIGYAISMMIEDFDNIQRVIPTPKADSEWCYVKTIQAGDSISENDPGNYNYQLISTSKGIDVYIKCEQI